MLMGEENKPYIDFQHVTKAFGEKVVLHDVSAAANGTLELMQWLVPRLKGRYEFKALDEVVRGLPALA